MNASAPGGRLAARPSCCRNRHLHTWFYPLVILGTVLPLGCRGKSDPEPRPNVTTQADDGESEALLETLNAALAATENLEPERAEPLWQELHKKLPDSASIARNRAINAALAVDALTSAATDSVRSAEEKQAARGRLPGAIERAREAIAEYSKVSGDNVIPLWLGSRIEAHEASLLPASMTKPLRRELLNNLVRTIDGPMGEQPQSVILGGPLTDVLENLSDPIDGLPKDILDPAAGAVRRLSDAHPENLFLALRALQLSIQQQNPAAGRYAERTWQLSTAVEPTLAAFTKPIGVTPKELTDRIIEGVEEKDWGKVEQNQVLWSNVLGPLEILRTDRRRASPHPLDRLSFEALRKLSATVAAQNPIQFDQQPLTFEADTLGENVRLTLPLDADLDLDVDLVSVSDSDRLTLWLNDNGQWAEAGILDLPVAPTGIVAADLFMVDSSDRSRLKQDSPASTGDADQAIAARHNTLPGLVVYGDFGIRLVQVDTRPDTPAESRLTLIEDTTGLEELSQVSVVVPGDLEGDGDLDLIVASAGAPLRTLINRGNRTFFEAPVTASTVAQDDPVVDLAIADLDRDLDLDVVTLHGTSGKVGLLENLLHLQFRMRYLDEVPASDPEKVGAPLAVAVEDVDGNVAWDVIVVSEKQSQVALGHSADIGVWTVDRVETGDGFATPPALADFDNDSFLELVGPQTSVRLGPWGIAPTPAKLPVPLGPSDAHAVDLNADGLVDLVSSDSGSVILGNNDLNTPAHHLAVRFKGIADNAAASGRVNHYAIGSVLETRFGPHYRSRIITGPSTHFGIDGADQVDSVRIIMPNGLTQTIRDPAIDAIVEEEQTLKGSCPYLYTWDGQKFAFVTDCLWAAPLGLQVAAGKVQPDRPWEYLKIDGQHVRPRDEGQYEFRLTEELWEVAYVDQVELTAVDHPDDVEVFTNEKVGPPSVAIPTIHAFGPENLHAIVAARDTLGNEVGELLAEPDARYVQGFDRRIRQGLCKPHWVDLDFGSPATDSLREKKDAAAYLVLRGWILPTDTSLNIQIDQNPELPSVEFPSVWVPTSPGSDRWQQVIPFMGFPGGKTKTIVVDVTEHLLRDDPRIRIRTSAQIYWDCARLAIQETSPEVRQQDCPLTGGEVAFHGFSEKVTHGSKAPETYEYARNDPTPKWPPLTGEISGFGDCTDRLTDWDDSMVVISSGDEIRMRFQAPAEPPPPGWKRDFILHCVGWDKDADLNTLTGQSIDPLPAKDMSAYPPTFDSIETFRAIRRKNADSLRRRQSFRAFWYRAQPSETPFLPVTD
ncbi:CRTAC1 family protein [Roseiconus nitratireducens]|uniref:CRTAC1 family protein n=1 Tax=Roseiconus nitratireducens TaxID=2605748 RepID=A0A5M6DDQ5_9BACT|nr:CRTAC1 family protein [Roseiconus nitratireducens]KAA5545523.1 CRTAC1 family protein [Roseiconus nitratireducens]